MRAPFTRISSWIMAVAHAFHTRRPRAFMISSTCYCRSSTYQEGAGVQEYDTNALCYANALQLVIVWDHDLYALWPFPHPIVKSIFWILLIVFPFVWARFTSSNLTIFESILQRQRSLWIIYRSAPVQDGSLHWDEEASLTHMKYWALRTIVTWQMHG